jgi:ring-1,2-phenylacetyl-CoA epoxidase subunit PaaC
MDRAVRRALASYLLAMGDDELVLGHRNSEWCGHAPILEEDIAFANLALDEIGHASAWYALLSELDGEDPDTYPDRLVYLREPSEFRNIRMVELPNGDWAFSTLRQFLFDAYEMVKLAELEVSRHPSLAGAASKVRKEELYHFRHSSAWVKRLGLGTEESHRRMQDALAALWPLAGQLFVPFEGENPLVSAGFVPPAATVESAWLGQVGPILKESGLKLDRISAQDQVAAFKMDGREQHTSHLKTLVTELQSVARLDPEAGW